VKGKAEKAVGNVRDVIHDATKHDATDRSVERDSDMDDNLDRESVKERE